uniref:Minor coat protein n=1 Tax=Tomato infectious chlorosis virus TaxID=52135 RepID=A0A097ZQU5_9CLOS|nr:minor coat protein [Tomato infectious chlorosis virus]
MMEEEISLENRAVKDGLSFNVNIGDKFDREVNLSINLDRVKHFGYSYVFVCIGDSSNRYQLGWENITKSSLSFNHLKNGKYENDFSLMRSFTVDFDNNMVVNIRLVNNKLAVSQGGRMTNVLCDLPSSLKVELWISFSLDIGNKYVKGKSAIKSVDCSNLISKRLVDGVVPQLTSTHSFLKIGSDTSSIKPVKNDVLIEKIKTFEDILVAAVEDHKDIEEDRSKYELPDVTSEFQQEDKIKQVRLYDVLDCGGKSFSTLTINAKFKPFKFVDMVNLLQLWYGDSKSNNLELLIRYDESQRDRLTLQLMYTKNGRWRMFEEKKVTLDEQQLNKDDGSISFGLRKTKNTYVVVHNGKTLYSFDHAIRNNSLKVGFEFQIPVIIFQKYSSETLKRPVGYGKIVEILIDGIPIKYNSNLMLEDNSNINIMNMKTLDTISSDNAKNVREMFSRKRDPDQENNNVEIVDIDKPNEKNRPSLICQNFIGEISDNYLRSLRNKCEKKLEGLGVPKNLTFQVLCQLSMTFSTSRECASKQDQFLKVITSDNKSSIVVNKKDVYQSIEKDIMTHRKYNLERMMLRESSKEVLDLLREGKLTVNSRTALKLGFLSEKSYLCCDFLYYNRVLLTEVEKSAVSLSLNKLSNLNKSKRTLVNVSQIT